MTVGATEEFFNAEVSLKEMEEKYVRGILKKQDNNVSETARILGVSRRWLHYKLKEWNS